MHVLVQIFAPDFMILSPVIFEELKLGVFETRIFRNFVSFHFDATLLCCGFVSFRINNFFRDEFFCFEIQAILICFVLRSKPNRERLN